MPVREGLSGDAGDLTARGLPPALLTMANYNGTLAAVRVFGRAGIPVVTADPSRLAVSGWSKYTTRRVQCPPVQAVERFLDWLMEFGAKGRGLML